MVNTLHLEALLAKNAGELLWRWCSCYALAPSKDETSMTIFISDEPAAG